MKANPFRRKKNLDLFEQTQQKLTWQYSGLIMAFLTFFVVVVYALLYVVISEDQKRELEQLSQEETRIISRYLEQSARSQLQGLQSQELVLAGADQFFYYVTDANGEFVMGSEAAPFMREELFALVSGWMPDQNQLKEETVQIVMEDRRIGDQKIDGPLHREKIRLLIDGNPIFFNGQVAGMIYIGKDISFLTQTFQLLFWVLLVLLVVFAGFAIWISHVMSKKAMIPISGAFQRQKEFVGDASHELRTPLSVMQSSIEAIEMTDGAESDPFARKLLGNMKLEVKRMTGLVSDLLVLARADSGSAEHMVEQVDVKAEAQQAIEALALHAASNNIALQVNAPEKLMAFGDRARLKQLMFILLDNAVKYSPDGGKVTLTLAANDRFWTMAVQDEGIGITAEDQPRIFDRFYRSDKSRTRTIGGHGLGLAIAKWIAGLHKGTIHVQSEVGKGSTFTVTIPFDQTSFQAKK